MRLFRRTIVASAVTLAGTFGGIALTAAPASAQHMCNPDIPCYPHLCVNIKQKPYVYPCGG